MVKHITATLNDLPFVYGQMFSGYSFENHNIYIGLRIYWHQRFHTCAYNESQGHLKEIYI